MTLLDREITDPDRPVEGTTWVLDGILTGAGADGVVSSVPSNVRATIRLGGGQLAVDTGCNSGTGTASLDGDTLTIGPLALTKRACEPDPTQVERLVTQLLHGAVTVAVDGPTLQLTGPDGGLMFRAE
jgi:heat shock protein HslJ